MTAGVTPAVARATPELTVSPITGTIGAELSGVDLAQELSDETVAAIRAALVANRVVFFRDQTLDYERQVAFGRRFGTLTLGHPTIQSPPDQPLMEEVDSAKGAPAADWHTDVTFLDQPVTFTCLRGVVMPDVGGDTVWANTVNVVRDPDAGAARAGRQPAGCAYQRTHRCPHRRWPLESRVDRKRQTIRFDDLPGRTSRSGRASRDRRTCVAARRFRPPRRGLPERPVASGHSHTAGICDPT